MKYAMRHHTPEERTRKKIFLYFSLCHVLSMSVGRDTVSSTAIRESANFVITETAA